ncbi:Arylsulfatase [Pontiella desulfatans]|uniref:Arylsulfatase n=1 Tax=Pontiella desulfatans TaxID=2750659 RepID=A0A6C2U7K2_PONDE|nr:sulfatase-like hydrolase/transferase [Pontiella desulfatans]SPS73968.1 sulfatase S1_28 [Kiritimatiellales bacterium]VGO15386.1 Arylsulfatase [Pontiella desulfatans]
MMKDYMKGVFAGLVVSCCCAVAQEQDKPNILFIFADDHTYEAIRGHGYLDIDTPNLDKLVERGASFTHAYNMGAWNGAVCIASRTMLTTGRTVWNAGMLEQSMKQEVEQGRMWAQQMKAAGYKTYFTGKWHVQAKPEDYFDVVKDRRGGMLHSTPKDGAAYNRPKDEADYEAGWKPWDKTQKGHWGEDGKHSSEVVADNGIEFIRHAAKEAKPFFMHLAFNAPHDPRQAPKEYIDRYPLERIKLPESFLPEYPFKDDIGCGKGLRDEALAPFPRTEYAVKVHRQEYFAIVSHMDHQIGRILDALEESGEADNTYIIFTADHGLACGHHGLIGKQNMYEDSVRAPFIMVGPGIEAGTKVGTPIYLQDVVPTTLELAGKEIPDYVEFKSLNPLFKGEIKHYDAIYSSYQNQQRMVMQDGWKLIYYPSISKTRLFNLKNDPFEKNDLAGNPEYTAKLTELEKSLANLREQYNDPLDFEDPKKSWNAYREACGANKKKSH